MRRSSTSGTRCWNCSGTDATVKAENELLAMLYRRHVEFAVGHGIGVHVDVSPDPNHAVRVRTKVVPSYEVPEDDPAAARRRRDQPAFAKLAGLVLDMKTAGRGQPQKQYRAEAQAAGRGLPGLDRPGRTEDRPTPPRGWRRSSTPPSRRSPVAGRRCKRIEAGWTCSRQDRQGGRGVPVHEPGHVAPADPLDLCRASSPGRREARLRRTSTCRRTAPGIRSSLRSSCSTCRASRSSITPNAAKARTPWPTCSGSPRAAARRRRTWA